MDGTQKRSSLSTAIIVALALSPLLTGCTSAPQGTVNQGTNGTVPSGSADPGGANQPSGAADPGGKALPADFPKDIPLASGTILTANKLADSSRNVWTVTIQVNDVNALGGITAQLESAGFTSKVSPDSGSDSTAGLFDKAAYNVLVVVFSDQKGGYIAGYTVTKK